MTGVPAHDLQAYFREARSWDQDRALAAERSRRFAWIVAGVATATAVAAVAAVTALAPLKSVSPFVVRVNQTTGAVDVMTALNGTKPTQYNEAVDKYFLAQYVRAREGWIAPAAALTPWLDCWSWASGSRRRDGIRTSGMRSSRAAWRCSCSPAQ